MVNGQTNATRNKRPPPPFPSRPSRVHPVTPPPILLENSSENIDVRPLRTKNVDRAGGGPKPGIPVDLVPGGKDRAAGAAGTVPGKRGKKNTKGALELVQQSTASMGK